MDETLDFIREKMGHPPRRLGLLSRWLARRRPPRGFPKDDELLEVYRQQDRLLSEGEVRWGALVQANSLLFNPGPMDHPAMTIYSPDKSFDGRPDELQLIGRRLFNLKHTTPDDPEERRLAAMITDEMERGLGWTVPKSCTDGRVVRSTGFMVFRADIPGRILRCGWFPLLVHPATPAVLIVPQKFWPQELIRQWGG